MEKILKIDDIKPYERNAKTHTLEQINKIARSIERFGFNQPLLIDKNNYIVAGHGRYMAAKALKLTEVRVGVARAAKGEKFIPAILADELTEDEIKAYRLADNRLNESIWEMSLVSEELQALPEELLDVTGFDEEIKDTNFEPIEESDKLDELSGNLKCPKCGHEFNSKNTTV